MTLFYFWMILVFGDFSPRIITGKALLSKPLPNLHVALLQDNQTDSGMVLASEEFERIEHSHRGAVLKRFVTQKLRSASPKAESDTQGGFWARMFSGSVSHFAVMRAHRSPKWHHFRAMSKQMMLHMFQSTWENILPWQEEVEESLAVSCAAKPALQRKYAWAGSQSTCGSKQYDSFRPWGPIFSHVLRSAFQKIFDKWHQLRVEMKTNTGPSNFAECKRGS